MVSTPNNGNGGSTTRYEAESAVLTNAVSETWRMTNPSGGEYAYVGNVSGASMAFTVNVGSAGSYDFEMAYSNTGSPVFKLIVNGSATTINATPSGGQTSTSTVSHTMNLNAGSNSVVIEHVDGWTCYDYIDVTGGSGDGNAQLPQSAPAAPTLATATNTSIALTGIAGVEYSNDNGVTYQSSNIFNGLSANTAYTFVQRKAETPVYFASPASSASTFSTLSGGKQQATAPAPPTLVLRTTNSITLTANSAFEFSIDNGVSYQSSNIFNGLSSNTGYSFVQRKAETSTHYASPASNSRTFTTKPSGGTNTENVWDKIYVGVNQDAGLVGGANFEKVQHEAGHMRTIADAGFKSVRFFISYYASPVNFRQRIQDALDNNLAVVLCLWGPNNWYASNQAESEISNKWTEIANWVESVFPNENEIVFELLNETGAIGFPQNPSGHNKSMDLYGAAARAVRMVSSARPILISPPGWQDADLLDYVTTSKMNYNFKNDPNCGLAVHFYKPSSAAIGWYAMNEYPLRDPNGDGWRKQVREELEYVQHWRTVNGVQNMPAIVTEWGFWSFPARNASGDLALTTQYHVEQFTANNIGGQYYTGIQNNQRAFAIFDSEYGWNSIVTEAITGVPAPTSWPATNQFIGSEFEDWSSKTWKLLNGGTHDRVQFDEAISGNSSIRLSAGDVIYQRTFVGNPSQNLEVGENNAPRLGKYLLHLLQGKTYRISFRAKSESSNSTIKFRMKENRSVANGNSINNQTGVTYYESSPIGISQGANTYEFAYTHTASTEDNLWFEFEVVSGTLIFDAVDLRQVNQNNSAKTGIKNKAVEKESFNNLELSVYPNPFKNNIEINGLSENELDKIKIFDIQGKQIYFKRQSTSLDLSHLKSGIYIFKIKDQTYKAIKY